MKLSRCLNRFRVKIYLKTGALAAAESLFLLLGISLNFTSPSHNLQGDNQKIKLILIPAYSLSAISAKN